ncbi:hypothetical protein FRC07_000767, partial [Ceratobasidium sp. 392]
MDSDTKAIMDAIMADGDDPMGALVANLGGQGLPPGVIIRSRRCSDASDDEEDLPTILRRIEEMEKREAANSKPGPSTPPRKPSPVQDGELTPSEKVAESNPSEKVDEKAPSENA